MISQSMDFCLPLYHISDRCRLESLVTIRIEKKPKIEMEWAGLPAEWWKAEHRTITLAKVEEVVEIQERIYYANLLCYF